jgi:hypothetical protein
MTSFDDGGWTHYSFDEWGIEKNRGWGSVDRLDLDRSVDGTNNGRGWYDSPHNSWAGEIGRAGGEEGWSRTHRNNLFKITIICRYKYLTVHFTWRWR